MKKMWFELLGAGLLSVAVGCAGEPEGMNLSTELEAIVGGTKVTGLPAVGVILQDGQTSCTGTLIAPRTVLTAGHCVDPRFTDPSRMSFGIGSSIAGLQYEIQVSDAQPHPDYFYDGHSIQGDIGLLYLAKDAPVAPMAFNRATMSASWVGKTLLFVGFGLSDGFNQTGDGIKRAVQIPVTGVFADRFRFQAQGKSTCMGDSGGPAFALDEDGNLVVVGVTSSSLSPTCSSWVEDTRVDVYQDFVESD